MPQHLVDDTFAVVEQFFARPEKGQARAQGRPVQHLALDLPADYFAAAFAEPNCTIRLIHYPPHPSPEDNEFGFAPHTDNNFIPFLAQSRLPGLEVRTAEDDWIRPPGGAGHVRRQYRRDAGALLE